MPFVWVGSALCAGTMATALASPLYPLYQELWGLTAGEITHIFIAYMFGVLGALLFFGRFSDCFGFLNVARAALMIAIAGLAVAAMAPSPMALLVSRVLIGIASGLITTSATLGLVRLEPAGNRQNASFLASVISILGFALGPFVAGLVAQFAPAPLVTPYVVALIFASIALAGILSLRGETQGLQSFRLSYLRPYFTVPPRGRRYPFLIAALSAFSAFGIFSLYASLAPSFLKDVIPWHGPAISGVAISLVLFCSALSQFPMRRMRPRSALVIGLAVLTVSLALLAAALHFHSAVLFLVSDVATGFGHGVSFMASLAIINMIASEENRSGTIASFFSVGYLGTIIPIFGVGILADWLGLTIAVLAFCLGMGVLTLSLFVGSFRIELDHLVRNDRQKLLDLK